MPETSNDAADVSDDQDQGEPATEKLKIDDFCELRDRDCDDGKRNELVEYINMEVPKNIKMMQFWSDNSKIFPNIFKEACRVFCVPASSAARELVFNTAGRLLETRRTTLSLNIVNSLLFLHSYMHRLASCHCYYLNELLDISGPFFST